MTTVLDAVSQVTNDARERLAMLMGALLEGGSIGGGPFPVGDSGTSFGPWQFHFVDATKLGLSPDQAADPLQSAKAILPAYSAAVKRVPDALWQSDPATAAATAAYYAEQPQYMYPAERIQAAFAALTNAAQSSGGGGGDITLVSGPGDWLDWLKNLPGYVSPGSGIADAFGSIGNTIAAPFVSIAGTIDKLANPALWWRLLFIIAGAGLVLLGVGILNKNAFVEAAGTFTGAAAKAA